MIIVIKPKFKRDLSKIRDAELRLKLDAKISQIENAKSISQITGLKLLRTFHVHFRIKVETEKHQYRIGAIIRKETIWLVRFLPRNKVYQNFP